ncbi:hypothetical protein ACIRL3_11035 [Streptomyces sp. NPDC102384]|uniref:hypothetical protein n=1 Tax=unclassified Streptomyces TaxID=2593676 RepID=UPI003828432C
MNQIRSVTAASGAARARAGKTSGLQVTVWTNPWGSLPKKSATASSGNPSA